MFYFNRGHFFLVLLIHLGRCLVEKSKLEVRNTVLLTTSSPCHIYELPANFQIVNIEFKEFNSTIKRIMIADQPLTSLDTCDDTSFTTCNMNSSYCLIMEEPEPTFQHAMGVCADRIYLHIYANLESSSTSETSHSNPEDTSMSHGEQPKTNKDEVTLGSLTTNFNFSKTCTSHLSKDDELAVKCATMSHSECYSDDECDERCQWISCTYNSYNQKDFFKEFTLCMPANIYAEDKICYDHYDYVNSPNKRFSFKKCGYPLNSYKLPGKEGITAGTVAIIVLLVLILLFIASIFYYRWSLSHRKVAPFTPPNFCPDWVYPKVDVEHPRRMKPMLDRTEYKPPDE